MYSCRWYTETNNNNNNNNNEIIFIYHVIIIIKIQCQFSAVLVILTLSAETVDILSVRSK